MTTIASYPAPPRALAGTDILLGSVGGATVAIPAAALVKLVEDGLADVNQIDFGSGILNSIGSVFAAAPVPLAVFGAVGNGLNDDTAAIRIALASGRALDGQGLTYAVSDTIVLATERKFWNATLRNTAASVSRRVLFGTGDRIELRRITVDLGTNGTSGSLNDSAGVWISGGDGHLLDEVEVFGHSRGNGIALVGCTNSTVRAPYVHDIVFDYATATDDSVQGIWFSGTVGCTVDNFRVLRLTGNATGQDVHRFSRGVAASANIGLRISNGLVTDCDQLVDISGGPQPNVGCVVSNVVGFRGYTWGIKLANTPVDCTVSSCTMSDCGIAGFVVSAPNLSIPDAASAKGITLVGCKAIRPGSNGQTLAPTTAGFLVIGDNNGTGGIKPGYPNGVKLIGCSAHDDQAVPTMDYGAYSTASGGVGAPNELLEFTSIGHVVARQAGFVDIDTNIAGKVDRYPITPNLTLPTGYAAAIAKWNVNWFDFSSNHIVHTGPGGIQNGLPTPSNALPSVWQSWNGFNVLFEDWMLAQQAGDAATVALRAGQLNGQWSHLKALYSASDLSTGSNGIAYTMDDALNHMCGLRQVALFYGPDSPEGQRAIGYIVELIPTMTQRFRDPLQTGTDLIDYNATTPGGIAFKGNRKGILYSAATDAASLAVYGYRSTSFEAGYAYVAEWLSTQPGVPVVLQAAFHTYASDVFSNMVARFRTPAPSDPSRAGAGIYYAFLNLDPNVDRSNDASVNGGQPLSGFYDANQRYLRPTDEYFGKPLRGITAQMEAGTLFVGLLGAALFAATGQAVYQAEALSVVASFGQTNAFGRMVNGLPLIGTMRDPHACYYPLPEFFRVVMTMAGADAQNSLRKAVMNTAKVLLYTATPAGHLSPNLIGPERSVADGTDTWEDQAGQPLGGGGQAKPDQIMADSCALNVVQSAMQIANMELALGSGTDLRAVIEAIPNQLLALKFAAQLAMTRQGGNFTGSVWMKDKEFRLDNLNGNPFINMQSGAYISRDRDVGSYEFASSGLSRMRLTDGGLSVYYGMNVDCPILPLHDNLWDLGASNLRFAQVFAATNTINTSDEREKTMRAATADTPEGEWTSAELDAGLEIARSIPVWMWNDAIARKGDDRARWHSGPTAQQVIRAFQAHGVIAPGELPTSIRHACVTYDRWEAREAEPAVQPVAYRAEVRDLATKRLISAEVAPVPGRPARAAIEAGEAYGLRLSLVQWLCIAAIAREDQRKDARLATLEAKLAG